MKPMMHDSGDSRCSWKLALVLSAVCSFGDGGAAQLPQATASEPCGRFGSCRLIRTDCWCQDTSITCRSSLRRWTCRPRCLPRLHRCTCGSACETNGDAHSQPDATAKAAAPEWINLFDGKTLGNWQSTRFGGEGDVTVENGQIVMSTGNDMTGITWKGDPPARINYEIELEAMRVDGHDFFCGLTFPVGKDPCSLILGGWGGGMTGLSSLDYRDASENETSQWIGYQNDRWYRIRLRVTPDKIEAWIDDKQIVNVETAGRKIGIRVEVEPSKPLGIATWRTTGAVRSIRLRKL